MLLVVLQAMGSVFALAAVAEPSCNSATPHDKVSMLQVKAEAKTRKVNSTKAEAMDSEKGKIIDIEDLKMEAFIDGMRLPNQQEKAELLRLTNIYRCMHGSSDLEWSNALASEVNSYISPMTRMVHDPNNKNSGENIYITTGQADAGQAVSMWYEEVNDCATGGPKSFTDGCMAEKPGTQVGHFTSMIWKGAQTLGCAYSSNNKLIMCRYGGDNREEITHNLEIPMGGGRFGIYEAQCNSANMQFHESFGAKDTCYVQQVGHLQKTFKQCEVHRSASNQLPVNRIANEGGIANGGIANGGIANGGVASGRQGGIANGGVASGRQGGRQGGIANGAVANGGVASGRQGGSDITVTDLSGIPRIEDLLKRVNCPDSSRDGYLTAIREKLGQKSASVAVTVTVKATASPGTAEIEIKTVTISGRQTETSTSIMSGSWS